MICDPYVVAAGAEVEISPEQLQDARNKLRRRGLALVKIGPGTYRVVPPSVRWDVSRPPQGRGS